MTPNHSTEVDSYSVVPLMIRLLPSLCLGIILQDRGAINWLLLTPLNGSTEGAGQQATNYSHSEVQYDYWPALKHTLQGMLSFLKQVIS